MRKSIDVGVVTILATELDKLRDVFGLQDAQQVRREYFSNPLYYLSSIKSEASGRDLSIAFSVLPEKQGNTAAAVMTAYFLRDWYPRLMCLVGIAAGDKEECQLADVMAPRAIFDVTVKKAVKKDGKVFYNPRTTTAQRHPQIEAMLKTVQEIVSKELGCSRKARKFLKGVGLSGKPSVRFDVAAASDNILLRTPELMTDLRPTVNDEVRMWEMEAAGFTLACAREGMPWIVVRGVSDHGDDKKTDKGQPAAAYTAALTTRRILERGIVIDGLPLNRRASVETDTLEKGLLERFRKMVAKSEFNTAVILGEVIQGILAHDTHYEFRSSIASDILLAASQCQPPNVRLQAKLLIDDLGWVNHRMGHSRRGISNIEKAIKQLNHRKDPDLLCKAHWRLASIYKETENSASALHSLRRARQCFKRINKREKREDVLPRLLLLGAELALQSQGPVDAIELLAQLPAASCLEPDIAARALWLRGKALKAVNQDEAACEALKETYGMILEHQLVDIFPDVAAALFDQCLKMNLPDDSRQTAQQAQQFALEIGRPDLAEDWRLKAMTQDGRS